MLTVRASIPWCLDHCFCINKTRERMLFPGSPRILAISPLAFSEHVVHNASNLEFLWKASRIPRLDLENKCIVWCLQIHPDLSGCFYSIPNGLLVVIMTLPSQTYLSLPSTLTSPHSQFQRNFLFPVHLIFLLNNILLPLSCVSISSLGNPPGFVLNMKVKSSRFRLEVKNHYGFPKAW